MPRRGAPGGPWKPPPEGAVTADLDGAIELYLAYLRVERGLADATILSLIHI